LVQITAPGEPFSGGYSSPQNGRAISELALWADAPELPASAPFVMSASLVRPAPTYPPHARVQPVQRRQQTGFLTDCPCLNPVGRLVSQERGFLIWPQNIVYISEARGQRLIPGEGGGLKSTQAHLQLADWHQGAIRLFSTQSPQLLHLVDIWLASACALTDHPVHHQHQDDEVMTVRPRQRDRDGPAVLRR
jgi:hypothetical protein